MNTDHVTDAKRAIATANVFAQDSLRFTLEMFAADQTEHWQRIARSEPVREIFPRYVIALYGFRRTLETLLDLQEIKQQKLVEEARKLVSVATILAAQIDLDQPDDERMTADIEKGLGLCPLSDDDEEIPCWRNLRVWTERCEDFAYRVLH